MEDSTPLSEKFELLSAYIDGEVTLAERKQVEEWLDSDKEFLRTYRELLRIQPAVKLIPIESESVPSQKLSEQVLRRLDRRNRLWVFGGLGALAAVAVGTLPGLLRNQQVFNMASQSPSVAVSTAPKQDANALLLDLDRPPVAIPVVEQ